MKQIISEICDFMNLLDILMWLLTSYWVFEDHGGKP